MAEVGLPIDVVNGRGDEITMRHAGI
jgi:hypothetical protein